MDRVTLIDKGLTFETRFAAPSVLTGCFVAAVLDSDRATVESAFTSPGTIFVHNEDNLFADKTYTGYTRIQQLTEAGSEIMVILDKGVS